MKHRIARIRAASQAQGHDTFEEISVANLLPSFFKSTDPQSILDAAEQIIIDGTKANLGPIQIRITLARMKVESGL